MTNAPVGGPGFDFKKYEKMSPVEMMIAIRGDLEFKMPPVGEHISTAIVGGARFTRVTWRCEREGCWYICTPRDPANLQLLKDQHYQGNTGDQCPTPPRRESLPSGLAEIEKLWREIDDCVKAIKAGQPYRDMSGADLNGFVRGLAWCIVMKDTELWPNIKAVSAEAMRRYKMHRGEIPYEATPTRHSNNFNAFQHGGWKSEGKPAPTPYKATAKKTAKAAPKKVELSPDRVAAVKAARDSGMFDEQDIAMMYGVTVEQIKML